ncbi:MAG: hypothetical protein C4557_00965 [Anaerolineaceae bacterium]|jgi:hypothetical protein|nr:MAG: hypothetical protein C4557_00965 [Anaerolineaceae bacterium]
MQSIGRLINFAQPFASILLGLSYFLPFYQSANGTVRYADEWGLFFWTIPVLVIIFKVSNRWLKAAVCFLSAIGGLLDLFLLTVLAAFKSTPLIGFHIARMSIIILVVSWLALIVISLSTPKDKN